MDTPVERKPGINRKHLYTIGGVALGIAVILYFIFIDTASSMTVEKDRLTIATVKQAEFNDYIRVIGQVMPNRIIYMDAIEGGRVEERLKEEGAMVKAGDVAALVGNTPIRCTIDGCLRGLLQDGIEVFKGMKCGDIDPRCKPDHCLCASDKALAVGGGVLEALLHLTHALEG